MGRESQQGSAVIWALLVTIFAMMLATAVCYTAYNSRKMAASYEREVTLRLAAEAALLEALQRVEKEPVLVDTGMIIARSRRRRARSSCRPQRSRKRALTGSSLWRARSRVTSGSAIRSREPA